MNHPLSIQNNEYKSVRDSQVCITELMIPSYTNFKGRIHAGVLLALMDKTAFACAAKHVGSYCVTTSVDQVDFFQSVHEGDLVHMKASVNYVVDTYVEVGVRVESENISTGLVKHTNTCYFTMMAQDERGRPVHVPGLMLENTEDLRRFMESRLRKKIRLQSKIKIEKKVQELDIFSEIDALRHERCSLAFEVH